MSAQAAFQTLIGQGLDHERAGGARTAEALAAYRKAADLIPGSGVPESRIEIIHARRAWGPPRPVAAALPDGTPRITMSTLGSRGRFGNQLLQYGAAALHAAFLDAAIEVPDWIGRDLFDCDDPPVSAELPALDFDARSDHALDAPDLAPGTDLRGYFCFDTSGYAAQRDTWRACFTWGERARIVADRIEAALRALPGPVIAVHVRRGDFGYGRHWIAPVAWYLECLAPLLARHPGATLYVASDDPGVAAEFAGLAGNPRVVTAADLDGFPEGLEAMTDHAVLRVADVLLIANSTFSFTAAMLNTRATGCHRPDPGAGRLVPFDPWAAPVLLDAPWLLEAPAVDAAEGAFLPLMMRDGGHVADVGAGRGDWTRAARDAHWTARRLTFHCFETDAAAHAALARLAETSGPGRIRVHATEPDLDTYCAAHGIRHLQALRLHAPRQALAILRGAARLLAHARIDCIQFRHDAPARDAGQRLGELHRFLRRRGFHLYLVAGPFQLAPLRSWSPGLESAPGTWLALHERMLPHFGLAPKRMADLAAEAARHGVRFRGVVHVGAHLGEEVPLYETLGAQDVVLVEANPELAAKLREKFSASPHVVIAEQCLADREEERTFHVNAYSQSSSLLALGQHETLYPFAKVAATRQVTTTTLDRMLERAGLAPERFNVLVIDVQGAEAMVLRGAPRQLAHVDLINVEVNFDEVYADVPQIEDIDRILGSHGFARVTLACPFERSWGDAVYVNLRRPGALPATAAPWSATLGDLWAGRLGGARLGSAVVLGTRDPDGAAPLAGLGWQVLYVETVPTRFADRTAAHAAHRSVDVVTVPAPVTAQTLGVLLPTFGLPPAVDLVVTDVDALRGDLGTALAGGTWRPRFLLLPGADAAALADIDITHIGYAVERIDAHAVVLEEIC